METNEKITKEQLIERLVDERTKLIEVMHALKCSRKQLNIAHKAIEELYNYDSESAIQYATAIEKLWENFLKTSLYKEQIEEYALNKFFGINKT